MDVRYQIRLSRPDDAERLRTLRIEGLRNHPTAFTADLKEAEQFPMDYWKDLAARGAGVANEAIFLADQQGDLAGMLGIFSDARRPKLAHSGTIWGVYVRLAHRGNGLGNRLLDAAIDWAQSRRLVKLRLSVVAGNERAKSAYERAGFTVYGVEPKAVQYDGCLYDEILMARQL